MEVNSTEGINGGITGGMEPVETYRSKHRDYSSSTHSVLARGLFDKFQEIIRDGQVTVNGEDLDIPTVVAVSRYEPCQSPRLLLGDILTTRLS